MIRVLGTAAPDPAARGRPPDPAQNQYAALTRGALPRSGRSSASRSRSSTKTMAEFLEAWQAKRGHRPDARPLDRRLRRSGQLHVHALPLRQRRRCARYFSSPETDRILEEARAESRPAAREALYRKFEHALLDPAILVPLFHDVDYRIASPSVRGLQLRSAAPYVNYAEIGKAEAPRGRHGRRRRAGGRRRSSTCRSRASSRTSIRRSARRRSRRGRARALRDADAGARGTRIVPWLASEVLPEDDGRALPVPAAAGRALPRRPPPDRPRRALLLRAAAARAESVNRWLLSPIRGAQRLIDGTGRPTSRASTSSRRRSSSSTSRSPSRSSRPSSPTADGDRSRGDRRDRRELARGAVGTGPFRVVSFEPGRRLELERNPHYWREGYPRSDGHRLPVRRLARGDPRRVPRRAVLRSRRISCPADAEAFRHDPRFASGYRESPSLIDLLRRLQQRHGAVSGRGAAPRASLATVDVAGIVRRTLGRLAIPAHGLIPPGLLGYSASSPSPEPSPARSPPTAPSRRRSRARRVELSADVHPIFFGEFSAFFRELDEALPARSASASGR